MKSYTSLLIKCEVLIFTSPPSLRHLSLPHSSLTLTDDFTPTTEGPFQKIDVVSKNFKNLFKPKDQKSTQPVLRKLEEDGKPGEIRAEDQMNDSLYICPVEVGTPPQLMNLHFDTGSSDLWVRSARSSLPCGATHSTASLPAYKFTNGSSYGPPNSTQPPKKLA
jgi:hypothetical protein